MLKIGIRKSNKVDNLGKTLKAIVPFWPFLQKFTHFYKWKKDKSFNQS
jgi:hypothetical protein